jgi:hypothetical protein
LSEPFEIRTATEDQQGPISFCGAGHSRYCGRPHDRRPWRQQAGHDLRATRFAGPGELFGLRVVLQFSDRCSNCEPAAFSALRCPKNTSDHADPCIFRPLQ